MLYDYIKKKEHCDKSGKKYVNTHSNDRNRSKKIVFQIKKKNSNDSTEKANIKLYYSVNRRPYYCKVGTQLLINYMRLYDIQGNSNKIYIYILCNEL